jgi:hypothetical protein
MLKNSTYVVGYVNVKTPGYNSWVIGVEEADVSTGDSVS